MKLLTLCALFAALLPAQNQEAKPPLVPRVFQIKHADPRALQGLLSTFGYSIQADRDLKVLTILAPAPVLSAIEDALKKLDVPPPAVQNIELTVYILGGQDEAGGSVPPEMEAVARQLRGTFGFKGFRLVDTQLFRVRPGQGVDSSSMAQAGAMAAPKSISQFRIANTSVSSDEKGRVVRLNGLRFGLKVPVTSGTGQYQFVDVGINTDIDVREGQKVVVGKTSMEGPEKAAFLVVMAKVVE